MVCETSIGISFKLWKELNRFKKNPSDDFDSIILRLIKESKQVIKDDR